jgi:hypothetical protein
MKFRSRQVSARRQLNSTRLAVGLVMILPSLGALVLTNASAQATGVSNHVDAPAALPTSLATTAGTWVSIPMGKLDQPLNTFWQLFQLPRGGSIWSDHVSSLATATNGGLVLASPGGKSLLVGIRPANLLNYSPVVGTSNARSWSAGPPIVGRVDALAASSTGQQVAVVDRGGTSEVLTAPSSSKWLTLTTERLLRSMPVSKECGILALTTVGLAPNGSVLVGTTCQHPGVVGLFVEDHSTWSSAKITLPSSQRGADVEVLRLGLTSAGITALFGLRKGSGESLVAAWETSKLSQWTFSPSLPLKSSQRVTSIGPSTAQGQFVVLSGSTSTSAVEVISGPQSSWVSLPSLKKNIATVAFRTDGTVDAFTSKGNVLSDYVLRAFSTVWKLAQKISVAIIYGSSG